MRPTSIQWFERLLLLALTIDLINNLVAWKDAAGSLAARGLPASPITILTLSILPPALGLILWYLVARRASNIARWITTILVILGTLGFAATAFRGGAAVAKPMFFVAVFAELLKLAAVACLFAASAAAWFARRQRPL